MKVQGKARCKYRGTLGAGAGIEKMKVQVQSKCRCRSRLGAGAG